MKIAEKFNQSAEDKATQYWQELLRPLASRENLVITAFCVGAEWGKNQSQPIEKDECRNTTQKADNQEVKWYRKSEIYNWLITQNYSPKIAQELSEKWADDLNYAFNKGREKALREKEQDTTDWHYQFRELSKSHVAQANLIHNLKCQLSDFLESSTKRETGTHPGRKKSKRKS